MPTPDVLASTVMDNAAALMNDAGMQVYTYTVQLPYLRMALSELREILELNNSPITNETTSSPITIPIGTNVLGFNTVPALPADLVEIQGILETGFGQNNYVPLVKRDYIPAYFGGVATNQLSVWAWNGNEVRFPAANAVVDIKLEYIKTLFTAVVDQNTLIGVINSDSYLAYRTAGLCSEFIGENKSRADGLNVQAMLATDRIVGIDNKGRQHIVTRHRPFRASYKSRLR